MKTNFDEIISFIKEDNFDVVNAARYGKRSIYLLKLPDEKLIFFEVNEKSVFVGNFDGLEKLINDISLPNLSRTGRKMFAQSVLIEEVREACHQI